MTIRRNRRVQALILLLICLLLSSENVTATEICDVHCIAGVSNVFYRNLNNVKNSQNLTAGVSNVFLDFSNKNVTVVELETNYVGDSAEATLNSEDATELNELESILDPEDTTEMDELEPTPDPKEVEMLAHLIYGEAGNQSDECQLIVGSVVLNRVKNDKYPNTLEKVIFQKKQYACTWDGNYDKEPSQQAWDNALWLLQNELLQNPEIIVPENVVYQAGFEQGSGTWKIIGPIYFCYQ